MRSHTVRYVLVISIVAAIFGLNHTALSAEPMGSTRYVDVGSGSDGGNNCLNPASPCRTIQRAVNEASSGDTILVGSGTYTYAGSDNPCDQYLGGLKAVVCIVNKQLTVLGGYSTGDWTSSAGAEARTFIDGGNRNRGIYVLSADPNRASEAGITMEGFTVRNGFTGGSASGNDAQTFAFGGGMLTDHAAVTLRNMRFENNKALGGGTQNTYGGSASGGGAAIRRAAGRAVLENVVFVSNQAEGGTGRTRGGYALGAGLYVLLSEMDGDSLEFRENVSQAGSTSGNGQTNDGQRGDAFGAGVTIMGYADVTLRNIVAHQNRTIGGNAAANGGGAFGGAIKAEGVPGLDLNGDGIRETVTLRIQGCDVRDNLAQGGSGSAGGISAGGGIESIHSTITIEGCDIRSNNSQGGNGSSAQGPAGGGGIYLQNISYGGPKATVKNSVIAYNEVAAGSGPAVGGGGGAVWLQGVEATLEHNTIVGNRLLTRPLQGSAILVGSDGTSDGPKPAYIRYNIIAYHPDDHAAALHVKLSNSAALRNNLFYENPSNINSWQVGTISGMDTSVLSDPRFADSSRSDDQSFQITSSSNAVDSAQGSSEPVDITNRPRANTPDIGAYESLAFQISVIPTSSGSLGVYWGEQSGIDHYVLTVSCPSSAREPREVECDTPAEYPGNSTGVRLTGLTNYANYSIDLTGESANGEVILSGEGEAAPTDIFVYVPVITR